MIKKVKRVCKRYSEETMIIAFVLPKGVGIWMLADYYSAIKKVPEQWVFICYFLISIVWIALVLTVSHYREVNRQKKEREREQREREREREQAVADHYHSEDSEDKPEAAPNDKIDEGSTAKIYYFADYKKKSYNDKDQTKPSERGYKSRM